MTTKKYDKTCARLVQEAASVPYTVALRWVKEHQVAHPESMPKETRALAIMNEERMKKR
jgi:hypothetical protein